MLTELQCALNPRLNYLYFTITSRCNAFCDFCWNWQNVADAGKLYKEGDKVKRNELSLKEIEKITLKLPKMLLVDLYGGEPFVRQDIGEIIDLFAQNCSTKYFSIPTNAFYTDRIESVLKKSLKLYPNSFFRIAISIDGPAHIHNRVRKLKNGYEAAIETAKRVALLKKEHKNLSLSLNSVYNRMTQDFMQDFMVEMMNEKIFDTISLGIVRGETYDNTLKEDLDLIRYYKLKKEIEGYRPFNNQPFSPLQKVMEAETKKIIEEAIRNPSLRRNFKCYGAKKFALLDDIGNVYACEHLLDKPIGNIRQNDYCIQTVIDSKEGKAMQDSIAKKECNCIWDCAINTSHVFNPLGYPSLSFKTAKLIGSKLFGKSE